MRTFCRWTGIRIVSRHHDFSQLRVLGRDDTWECSFCKSILVGTVSTPPKPDQVVAKLVKDAEGQKLRVEMTCEEVAVLRIHAS